MISLTTTKCGAQMKAGSHTDRPNRLLPKLIVLKWTVCVLMAFVLAMWYFDLSYLTSETFKGVATRLLTAVAPKYKSTNTTGGVNDTYGKGGVLTVSNQCPPIPPNLVGHIPTNKTIPSLDAVEKEFPDVTIGGRFRPKECISRHRVAILIPYRDRAEHLKIFIYNLHKVLSRQQIDYGVFVIEQGDNRKFNRAMLFNIGFLEATALYDYQCFIFHDVDLVPTDDRNIYNCPEIPRHLAVWVDDHSFVYYPMFFGGVSALKKEHMLSVNGFSNKYWGWGAEDDDMSNRLKHLHLNIHRRPASVARYTALKHVKAKPSEQRFRLLHSWKYRYKKDGLNSVKYKRLDMVFNKLYTWILVDLRGP
ncbi:beta-1,4-N-acetylgalactosaminyltransferase bre-4-like isoform X1 [Haemaphysalis longicornis]